MNEDEQDESTTASEEELQNDSRSDDAPEVKAPSMLDAVKKARGGAAESKETKKPDAKTDDAASAKGDDAKDDEQKAEGDGKGDDEEPEDGWLPESELVGKDLRNVDLKRVRPELRTTVQKMQQAERKKHEKLNALIAEAEAGKEPEKRSRDEKADDEEENPYLEDVRAALKTKKGREMLRELLREEGLDLKVTADIVRETAGDRVLTRALTLAADKYEELSTDKSFFDDTVKVIASDEDMTSDFEAAEKAGDSKALNRVFREAAATVRAERERSERKRVDKQKATEKATRDEKTVKNPGSPAGKAGRKAPLPDGPMSTMDRIKQVREQLSTSV